MERPSIGARDLFNLRTDAGPGERGLARTLQPPEASVTRGTVVVFFQDAYTVCLAFPRRRPRDSHLHRVYIVNFQSVIIPVLECWAAGCHGPILSTITVLLMAWHSGGRGLMMINVSECLNDYYLLILQR